MVIPRALQIALYRWNTDNTRARTEYAEHPTATCQSLHDPEPCDDLAQDGDHFCRRHRAIAAKKLAQRRKART